MEMASPSVYFLMCCKTISLEKALFTMITWKWFLTSMYSQVVFKIRTLWKTLVAMVIWNQTHTGNWPFEIYTLKFKSLRHCSIEMVFLQYKSSRGRINTITFIQRPLSSMNPHKVLYEYYRNELNFISLHWLIYNEVSIVYPHFMNIISNIYVSIAVLI